MYVILLLVFIDQIPCKERLYKNLILKVYLEDHLPVCLFHPLEVNVYKKNLTDGTRL